jgi:hypothetical protein
MSKHVLNTRLTGAFREGIRECVRGNAVARGGDDPAHSTLRCKGARADEPFVPKFSSSSLSGE